MKYSIIVLVDETMLREATEDKDSPVESLIQREAGWMEQSGISAKDTLPLPTDEDQPLVDAVIKDLKRGFQQGDYTVLDELLKFIPVEYLKGSLPE